MAAGGARFTATFGLRFAAEGEAAYSKALKQASLAAQKAAQEQTAASRRSAAEARKSAADATKAATEKSRAAQRSAAEAAKAAQAEIQASQRAAQARTREARQAATDAAKIATARRKAAADDARAATQAERTAAQRVTASRRAEQAVTKAAAAERRAAADVVHANRQMEVAVGKSSQAMATAAARQKVSQSALIGYAKSAAAFAGIGGLGAAVRSAHRFDASMREVSAVSGATGRELQQLSKIAKQTGLDTASGAAASAEAMVELTKAGLSAKQIGPALEGVLLLARAGSMGTAEAATAASDAMNSFGIAARDTTRIADAFANAANLTTADVSHFAQAISQGGSAAKLAGVSFQDTVLTLTQLANIGVKGSDAGTSMKTAFLQLARPTKQAEEAMSKYSLSFFDAEGNMRGVAEIGEMLRQRLGKLSKQQQTATLQTIAGTDGFRTLAAMMGTTSQETRQLERDLFRAGSAAKQAETMRTPWEKFQATMQHLSVTVGDKLLVKLNEAADAIARFARSEQGQRAIQAIGDAARVTSEVLSTVVSAVVKLGAANPEVLKLAAGFVAVGAAVKAIRFVGALTGVTQLIGLMGRLRTSSQAAAAATAAVGAGAGGAAAGGGLLGRVGKVLGSTKGRVGIGAAAGVAGVALSGGNPLAGAAAGGMAGSFAGPIGMATGALIGGGVTALIGALGGKENERLKRATARLGEKMKASVDEAYIAGMSKDVASAGGGAAARLREGQRIARKLQEAQSLQDPANSPSRAMRERGAGMQEAAERAAKAAGFDPAALLKGVDHSNAFKNAGKQAGTAFVKGLNETQFANARGLLRQFDALLGSADRTAQQQGARKMIAMAKGMEAAGSAPKGTVERLIRQLDRQYDGLATSLVGKSKATAAQVARELSNPKIAEDVNRLAGQITTKWKDTISDLPRTAVRTVPGAVATMRQQMLALIDLAKNGPTKEIREAAKRDLDKVRATYRQSFGEMAKMYGASRKEAREWGAAGKAAADTVRKAGGDAAAQTEAYRREVQRLGEAFSTAKARTDTWKIGVDLLSSALKKAGVEAAAVSTLTSAVTSMNSLIDRTLDGEMRRGGRVRFATGGMVPSMLSPGEIGRTPGGQWFGVPGRPVAADTVPMMLAPGTEIYTGHGQELLASGASRARALSEQMPHFNSGGIVSKAKVAAGAAKKVGLKGNAGILATAIAGGESTYNPRAHATRGEDSRGLWQINLDAHGWARKWNLWDPVTNAKAMHRVSGGGKNWGPWTVYKTGAYTKWMDTARKAWGSATPASASAASSSARSSATDAVSESGSRVTDDLTGRTARNAAREMRSFLQPNVPDAFSQGFAAGQTGARSLRDIDGFMPAVNAAARVNLEREARSSGGGSSAGSGTASASFKGLVYPFSRRYKHGGGPGVGTHNGKPPYNNWMSSNAVDIEAPVGAIVRAVANGTIVDARGSWSGGGGRSDGLTAYLRPASAPGKQWFFQHMKQRFVRKGQRVRAGQRIGVSGAGNGVPHLHLASETGNPATMMSGAPTKVPTASRSKGTSSGRAGSTWLRPVGGPQSSGFGMRSGRMHKGIDYAVPVGTAVKAIRGGIAMAGIHDPNGWGTNTRVDHGGGWSSLYAHLSRVNTRPGQRVNRGQVIARSGNTGRSTGPHLHLETWRNGSAVNPAGVIGKRFRSGGKVRPGTGASAANLTARASGRAVVARQLRSMFGAGTRDNSVVTDALDRLAVQLSSAETMTAERLTRLSIATRKAIRQTVAKSSPAGKAISKGEEAMIRRARSVRSMVMAEFGRRAGERVAIAGRIDSDLGRYMGQRDRDMRRANIDSASSAGLAMQADTVDVVRTGRLVQRQRLEEALTLARKAGKGGAQDVTELKSQIAQLTDEIDDLAVQHMELWRQQLRAAAQEALAATQFDRDLVSADTAIIEAVQRVTGTSGTPAGMRELAGRRLLDRDAAMAAKAAWDRAGAVAWDTGDIDGWRQAMLGARQALADATNAQADYNQQMKEAASLAAAQVVGTAEFGLSMAQLEQQGFSLRQQLAGTAETGGAARAQFIRSTVIPAIQRAIDADRAAVDVERRTWGQDSEQHRQAQLRLAQRMNELLQAQLDEQEQIKSNTAQRSFGGSLGFEFAGGAYTDLILDGAGA
ncbi:MAG: phage tail tape measure protein [Solirubrobacteraceae bacterium]|nr:phage tail tape measure protein [Solirubrobacteraceae bacterium]